MNQIINPSNRPGRIVFHALGRESATNGWNRERGGPSRRSALVYAETMHTWLLTSRDAGRVHLTDCQTQRSDERNDTRHDTDRTSI
jgi:hypothetical protein